MIVLYALSCFWTFADSMADSRPPKSERTFQSTVVDNLIEALTPVMKDTELATIFANCFPNTLDTTVYYFSYNPLDTFIITGDISALWLRDSANQVMPYLPYGAEDDALQSLFEGLISRFDATLLNASAT
jgi:meiotically up-regulated gene 157 (Mug157) protein